MVFSAVCTTVPSSVARVMTVESTPLKRSLNDVNDESMVTVWTSLTEPATWLIDVLSSVAEFADALAYYERPGRPALVQQAVQKFASGPRMIATGNFNAGVYATNGVPVTPGLFGLNTPLLDVYLDFATGGYIYAFDRQNQKVKAFANRAVWSRPTRVER